MTSLKDKEPDGPGASISLAIAGLVAAGLGLATMSFAFQPLPKPGVPVVISTSAPPVTRAAFRHLKPRAITRIEAVVAEDAAPTPAAAAHPRHAAEVQPSVLEPAAPEAAPASAPAPEPQAKLVPAQAVAPAATAKPPIQVAKADGGGEKLCKAPQTQVLSAKTLQSAMALRYDAQKARVLDIQPTAPSASEDTERRIKLTALLANMLDN